MQNNRIKELREQLGLTKEQLSELVGMSAYTITKWERGHHVPDKHFERLSKAFNLPIERIVWDESTDHREINYIEDPSHYEPSRCIRPQVECFCGNCDFWKEGNELLLKCTCKRAEKYGSLTGRNFLCTHWFHNGISYTDVLSVLPDDNTLCKNLVAVKTLMGISVEQVCLALGIDEAVWEQYEKGVCAIPLQQLALFSELCGISADKLVKENLL